MILSEQVNKQLNKDHRYFKQNQLFKIIKPIHNKQCHPTVLCI